jgi:uncharacterized protein
VPTYAEKAEAVLRLFSAAAEETPTAVAAYMMALSFHCGPVQEIAIAGRVGAPDTARLLEVVRRRYAPARLVARIDPAGADAADAAREIPLLAGRTLAHGCATAYLCQGQTCREPTASAADLERLLDAK